MYKRTLVGLCAALAFAAGSPAVHALMIVDSLAGSPTATDGSARASNTYAKEMLTTAGTTDATVDADTTTYYDIAQTAIYLSAPADISANPGDTYVVSYTLDGMVFQGAAVIVNPSSGFSLAAGGKEGDNAAVFRMAAGAPAVETDALITLGAQFAISAAGSGSVTRTVTNQTLSSLNVPGVTGSMVHVASGVIKLASGLKEMAKAVSPIATVAHSFRSFNGSAVATVGSLLVTYDGTVRQNNAGGDLVSNLDQIIDNAVVNGGASESTVQIMGDFSFATNAYLHGDADCLGADAEGADKTEPPAAPGILKTEGTGTGDDTMVVGVNAQNVAEFAREVNGTMGLPAFLCIAVTPEDVDGMRIPETVAYTAMGDYEGVPDDAAFDPAPMEQMLGAIKRDGTTIGLPYLTTNAKFNQRLYIVNRGPVAAYEMDFQMGDTAGEMASGMLEANSRTTLLVGDLVTVGEGGSTAGTLIIEAQPNMIDAATVQVSRGTRYDRYGGLRPRLTARTTTLLRQRGTGKKGFGPSFFFWE